MAGVKFIRDAASVKDGETVPDDAELLKAAWAISPERTVCALAEVGLSTKEIAAKLGYKSDDQQFQKLLRDSQDWLKAQITHSLVSQIPAEVLIDVVDADGVSESVNVAHKLKKGVVAAMFDGKKSTVTFSAAKGAPVTVDIASLFNMSIAQVTKQKAAFKSEYAKTFRTRDTGGLVSGNRPLAPALAKLGVVGTPTPKAE